MEIELDPAKYDKFAQASIKAGLIKPGDDPGVALQTLVHRFLAKYTDPEVTKAHRRIDELEAVLDLEPGHSIMEANAVDFIWNLLREPTMMLDGWDFEDPATAEANIRCLVDRWTTEDAMEQAAAVKGKEEA